MKPSTFCTEALVVGATVVTLDSNYYLLGNKVLDGKFELWTDASTPRFWTPAPTVGSTVDRNGTYYHDGAYSVRLSIDGLNSPASISQTISLIPGYYYTGTIYVRNSAVGKTGKFTLCDTGGNVYLKDDGTWDTSAQYLSIPNSFQVWTAYTVTFQAPNYSTYTLTLGNDSAASSNIYFDSLTLLEASTGRPGAQFPQVAREAEIFCHDAAIYYGMGGSIPTGSTGFLLEPGDTEPRELKVLKNFDEIRTFRAIRNGLLSSLLMVNYKR